MNKRNSPTPREVRFNQISQRQGLAIAALVLSSLFLQAQYPLLSGVLAIVALAALIMSFLSGYRRSDELQKLVHLKAAAISFVVVMFMAFAMYVIDALEYAQLNDAAGTIFVVGILLHMFLLPGLAKRAYEK